MAWLQKLYETYENAPIPMPPPCHTSQQAHIEVCIDGDGQFLGARVLEREEAETLVPCTEASETSRVGIKPVHHPLCDKLQYLAGDFVQSGGIPTVGFAKDPEAPHRDYLRDLIRWADSSHGHPKVQAIRTYVEKGCLVRDLTEACVLPVSGNGHILQEWAGGKKDAPALFRLLGNPQTAFVRWRVEIPGDFTPDTWKDATLQQAWMNYCRNENTLMGFCMVKGEETYLAERHPAKILPTADKAKLISSNDTSGFTFRGRFLTPEHACTVGFEVSQKAHIALRELVKSEHAFRDGEMAIVAWCVGGKATPKVIAGSLDLLGDPEEDDAELPASGLGQAFARRFSRYLAGYEASLGSTDGIVVLGLDSATPGRMAMTFYRELTGSELMERVAGWHLNHAWLLLGPKGRRYVGSPSPRAMAEAAYGRRSKDKSHAKLLRATVERILPCIIDGTPLPQSLVVSAFRRACNRPSFSEWWEFEQHLGITCALIRGYYIQEAYAMALDPERNTRDYLFGRLLAVAENLESYAHYLSDEKGRMTHAAKLMHRFADHPASTWLTLEKSLIPYHRRLQGSGRGATLQALKDRMTDIINRFQPGEFTDDNRKLQPEFLLGYHCERQALAEEARKAKGKAASKNVQEDVNEPQPEPSQSL